MVRKTACLVVWPREPIYIRKISPPSKSIYIREQSSLSSRGYSKLNRVKKFPKPILADKSVSFGHITFLNSLWNDVKQVKLPVARNKKIATGVKNKTRSYRVKKIKQIKDGINSKTIPNSWFLLPFIKDVHFYSGTSKEKLLAISSTGKQVMTRSHKQLDADRIFIKGHGINLNVSKALGFSLWKAVQNTRFSRLRRVMLKKLKSTIRTVKSRCAYKKAFVYHSTMKPEEKKVLPVATQVPPPRWMSLSSDHLESCEILVNALSDTRCYIPVTLPASISSESWDLYNEKMSCTGRSPFDYCYDCI